MNKSNYFRSVSNMFFILAVAAIVLSDAMPIASAEGFNHTL